MCSVGRGWVGEFVGAARNDGVIALVTQLLPGLQVAAAHKFNW